MVRRKPNKKVNRKKFNQGGLLRGPQHSQGGMPAIISGKEQVELEGGEYIIRKSSVDKYGAETIARINQGLVDPTRLRQLKKGGQIMQMGGRTGRMLQSGGQISHLYERIPGQRAIKDPCLYRLQWARSRRRSEPKWIETSCEPSRNVPNFRRASNLRRRGGVVTSRINKLSRNDRRYRMKNNRGRSI